MPSRRWTTLRSTPIPRPPRLLSQPKVGYMVLDPAPPLTSRTPWTLTQEIILLPKEMRRKRRTCCRPFAPRTYRSRTQTNQDLRIKSKIFNWLKFTIVASEIFSVLQWSLFFCVSTYFFLFVNHLCVLSGLYACHFRQYCSVTAVSYLFEWFFFITFFFILLADHVVFM